MLQCHTERRIPKKRHLSGHHFVQDHTQGINIRPLVCLFPVHLLRAHVIGGSDDHSLCRQSLVFLRPGNPEVHDLGVALLIDHDVLGFQIPVHDPQTVGLCQSVGHLQSDTQHIPQLELSQPFNNTLQVLPLHILHGDEVGASCFVDVMHAAYVLVGDPPGELQFVAESGDRVLVCSHFGFEDFKGHIFLDLGVENFINKTHSPLAELLDDVVTFSQSVAFF